MAKLKRLKSTAPRFVENILYLIGKPLFYLIYYSLNLVAKKLSVFTILLFLFLSSLIYLILATPSPHKLLSRKVEVSTKIYDRNGILLYTAFRDKKRTLVPLSQIPKSVRLATLAAEDAEFYSHFGFSIKGITRALKTNIREKRLTGGSTITQQLVKNAFLTPEKTLKRKLLELILSIKVEIAFSKDQILEMYLNEVPFGGTSYGIYEASRTYFAKEPENLSLSEAAFLAGLPKSPSKYSPYGPTPEAGIQRQLDVLNLMEINRYITEKEEQTAKNQELKFAKQKTDIKAPHFVMFIRQLLEDKYGTDLTYTGGLKVITTLDYKIQLMAEKILSDEISKLKNLNVGNGGVLVINPQSGEILAMVGSTDYFDTKNQGNVNTTLALRSPGSSIKVVNYSYALSNGFTPANIISDSLVTFNIEGSHPYTPKNYDDKFRGNLTLRSALAESRNVPAVRVLASYGVENMVKMGKKMGITTWNNPFEYGLSLTLGGGSVKLIDLAKVYSILANYGKRAEFNPIIKITDYRGGVVEKNEYKQEKVLDPRVAFLITDVLKDNYARSPAFGLTSSLVIKNHPEVAVKTGTSNNLRDNLTLGYNQNYLVAVWVGNNDNSPMSKVASGVTGASPIFNRVMTEILKDEPAVEWEIPAGLTKATICTYTNTLSCSGCANKIEWFIEGTAPKKHCNPEIVNKLREKKSEGEIFEEAASTSN